MVGAGEGFLPGMNPNMIDQLVLGLEWPPLPGAVGPVAGVVRDLRPAHVVHGQVGHYVVHGVVRLLADLLRVLVDPLAGHLCLHITHSLSQVLPEMEVWVQFKTSRKSLK